MAYTATAIHLSAEESSALEKNVRAAKTEQRLAFRSRIILLAADGMGTGAIAAQLQTSPATVSKWRVRFARVGLEGLADAPRCGAPGRYSEETERRILAQLDEPLPGGRRCGRRGSLRGRSATSPRTTSGGSCGGTASTCSGAAAGA